jgi:hypothetical protein
MSFRVIERIVLINIINKNTSDFFQTSTKDAYQTIKDKLKNISLNKIFFKDKNNKRIHFSEDNLLGLFFTNPEKEVFELHIDGNENEKKINNINETDFKLEKIFQIIKEKSEKNQMIKFEDLINSENNINSENIDTIINFLKNNIVNEFETQKIIIKLENKFKKKKWICRLFQ